MVDTGDHIPCSTASPRHKRNTEMETLTHAGARITNSGEKIALKARLFS